MYDISTYSGETIMPQPSPTVTLVSFAISIFLIVCYWKLYKKANLPGCGSNSTNIQHIFIV